MTSLPSSGNGSWNVLIRRLKCSCSRMRMGIYGHLQLPFQGSQTARGFAGNPEAELSGDPSHDRHEGAAPRFSEGYPVALAALALILRPTRAANGRDGLRDAHRQRRLADGELSICYQMLPITDPQGL